MLVRASYEFWAENNAELNFQVGDIIRVIRQDDPGWWEGELNGQVGLFPSTYVEPYTPNNNAVAGRNNMMINGKRYEKQFVQTQQQQQQQWNNYTNGNINHNQQDQNSKYNNTNINNNNNYNYNNNNNQNQPSWAAPQANQQGGRGQKPSNLDTYNSILNSYQGSTQTQIQNKSPNQTLAQLQPKFDELVKKAPQSMASGTKYGIWASNMGEMTGLIMIAVGPLAIVWYEISPDYFSVYQRWTGIYGIVIGMFIVAYEWSHFGKIRGPSRIPWRAFVYTILGIFQFFSFAMILTGLCCVVVAGANLLATINGETYDSSSEQKQYHQKTTQYFSSLYHYLEAIQKQNRIGTLVFVGLYLASNLVIFFVVLWQFIQLTAATEQATGGRGTSYWVPYAKAFGNTLDWNCSIIVLPVCRTFLRMLYNRSTADQGFVSRCLRGILYFIPIDKNLAFHKLIAKGILIGAIGHTVAHFLNFAFTPSITYGIFGLSPFLTGGLLCAVMLLMYSSSRDNVRRGQFEIFWYNHHLFVIFFLANIFHGKGSFGPNYYKWFAGPGAIYFLERMLRIYRANQKVVVLSVTVMDDIFSLEIAKEGVFETPYKEGQYVFIQAPAISQIQWHPFTISSAPQEQSVTIHVRVLGEGSWTRGLRDYIGAMGPRRKPFFQLDRQGPNGRIMGKILGPDGKHMLHIDGPHSAPTQHIGEYSAAIIAGAGIGVTPVAATLKSIVFHRWKYFIGQCYPDHAYFVWVCGHKDVHAFRWLIRHIKDAQDEITHMRSTNPENMAAKTFEFHIYVSSVPKDQKPVDVVVDDEIGFWGVPREDAKVDKLRCNWDETDLYKTMICPSAHTVLDDVHVWNGRPDWNPRFEQVSRAHRSIDIGVMFCGNPMIGRDLRRQCHIHSQGRTQGIFKLHKENF